MLNSLNAGVSGIRTFQASMDVIGNDIANSNTIAYKSARATFADAFSQTLQGGTDAGGKLQVGSGVQASAIKNDFSRGSYQKTGKSTDLYIDGQEGFFIVRNDAGHEFATRAGDFVVRDGYLVTNEGHRVQGYNDHVLTGAAFTNRGDIRIADDVNTRPLDPIGTDPNPQFESFEISANGRVHIRLSDGTNYDVGQILLQRFENPSVLEKQGNNLFNNLERAGALATPVEPGFSGTGGIISGALEMSNVDLAAEFAELITTQRGFQANARIITTSDEMLQEVVNLKR